MSKTTRRIRFNRFNMKVYAEERIWELEAGLDPTWAKAFPAQALEMLGSLRELKRLLKHWKLEKS